VRGEAPEPVLLKGDHSCTRWASKSRARLVVIHALEWAEESEAAPRYVEPVPTSDRMPSLNSTTS
jgi:hypothetical protein